MSVFSAAEIEYLQSQRLGRLATSGPDGQPHVVPVSALSQWTTATLVGETTTSSLRREEGRDCQVSR